MVDNSTKVDQQMCHLVTQMNQLVDEILPFEPRTELVLVDGGKNIQVPMTFVVEPIDRNVVAQLTPPAPSTDSLLADLLTEYEKEIKPHFEGSKILNETFKIDTDVKILEAAKALVEETIDQQEKERFYQRELDSIFTKLITSSMDLSNLQMTANPLASAMIHDPVTGELRGFTNREEEPLEPAQAPLANEGDIERLLEAVELIDSDEEEKDQADGDEGSDDEKSEKEPEKRKESIPQDERTEIQMIKDFLDEQRDFLKHTRTADEDEKDIISEIKINQIAKKKPVTVHTITIRRKSDEPQQIDTSSNADSSKDTKIDSQESSLKDGSPMDELDVLVEDSQAFKEAVSQAKDRRGVQVEPSKFHQANVQKDRMEDPNKQTWIVVDTVILKHFNELIPDPAISYPFELDDFQKRAVYRLEQGNCVFVAAHTSAGKTVVAEYAIALAMKHMTKAIYTSPLKALSNQKYREFKDKFKDVGIFTGDVQLNRGASCIVMTTEILQSMLYNDAEYIQDVEWVIFDEVHYINDEERGSVWEEVIIKLPDHISIVMLSATVPNYKEFAEWVGRTKRKKVYVQCTDKRPVPLRHYVLYKEKLHLIKDENNNLLEDTLKKVLKQEQQDTYKKRNDPLKKEDNKGAKASKGGEKKEKEIDFKEKSLKAKEKQLQRVARKGQKGTGGGENSGQAAKKRDKFSKFYKNLRAIAREKLLPCVVFSFSRAACEEIALSLDETMEFTTGAEKGDIKKFLKQKLQRLNEFDRQLPQILTLSALLIRGIGIHHAGMLPIVKELVEILFSDGFLKVVFATTTFAIGLNMPARSVLFTQTYKWNKENFAMIQSSEYLQMAAGRAGRRGKDETGASVIYVDRSFGHVPTTSDFEAMLENKGQPLESKLNLSYKLILSIVKSEGDHIEDILKQSFFENENEKEKLKATSQASSLQRKIQKIQHVECIYGVPEHIEQFYTNYLQLQEYSKNVLMLATRRLQPGYLVQLMTPSSLFENAVVLKVPSDVRHDEYLCLFIKKDFQPPITFEEEVEGSNLRAAKEINAGWYKQVYYEYVKVSSANILKVYQRELKNNSYQFIKENLVAKSLNVVIDEFITVGDFNEVKHPKEAANYIKERNQILEDMKQLQCSNCKFLNLHLGQVQTLDKYQQQLEAAKKLMSTSSQAKLEDFNAKTKVLIHYKYLDYDLNLLFKGRVANEINTVDKFLMTELIFSGHLKNLTNEEVLALYSVLLPQINVSKADECTKEISPAFQDSLMFLYEEAMKLCDTETKYDVVGCETDPAKRLNYCFYEIIYEWANQQKFVDIVKLNQIDEGMIIKMVMSVEQVCKTVKAAAKVIGDANLAQRMDQAALLIKRDIIFTQSLYLE